MNPKQKLINLAKTMVKAADDKLYVCNSKWPPWGIDTVKLNDKDLSIIYRNFWIKDVRTIHIENLSSVEVVSGPIFAHLIIKSKYLTTGGETGYIVNWLLKGEAEIVADKANALMAEASNKDTSGGQ